MSSRLSAWNIGSGISYRRDADRSPAEAGSRGLDPARVRIDGLRNTSRDYAPATPFNRRGASLLGAGEDLLNLRRAKVRRPEQVPHTQTSLGPSYGRRPESAAAEFGKVSVLCEHGPHDGPRAAPAPSVIRSART